MPNFRYPHLAIVLLCDLLMPWEISGQFYTTLQSSPQVTVRLLYLKGKANQTTTTYCILIHCHEACLQSLPSFVTSTRYF